MLFSASEIVRQIAGKSMRNSFSMQASIPGSVPNLLGEFQPLIEVVEGNHLGVIVYGSLGS